MVKSRLLVTNRSPSNNVLDPSPVWCEYVLLAPLSTINCSRISFSPCSPSFSFFSPVEVEVDEEDEEEEEELKAANLEASIEVYNFNKFLTPPILLTASTSDKNNSRCRRVESFGGFAIYASKSVESSYGGGFTDRYLGHEDRNRSL